jgi:hypothetical protein
MLQHMGFTFDYKHWPICRVKVVGDITEADVRWIVAEFDKYCALGLRWVMIVDCLTARSMGASARSILVNWEKANAVTSASSTNWCAFVFSSAVVRGIFTALAWLGGFPHPVAFYPTLDQAEAAAEQKLKELKIRT